MDFIEGERRFVTAHNRVVRQQHPGRSLGITLIEVLLLDQFAAGDSMSHQLSDHCTAIEDGLPAWLHRVGENTLMAPGTEAPP